MFGDVIDTNGDGIYDLAIPSPNKKYHFSINDSGDFSLRQYNDETGEWTDIFNSKVGKLISVFHITSSIAWYSLHNSLDIGEFAFIWINADVMQAKTTINATGIGYCALVESDLLMCVLKCGYYLMDIQISGNAVSIKRRVNMDNF